MLIKLSAFRKLHHGDAWSVVAQVNISKEGMAVLRAVSPQPMRNLFADELTRQDVWRDIALALRQLLNAIDTGALEDPGAGLRVARQLSVLNHMLAEHPRAAVEVSL